MNTRVRERELGLVDKFALAAWHRTILSDVSDLVRLATPMVVARGGIIFMTTIDIIMVANYAIRDVAYQAIGLSVVMPMIVIGMGLLMGTHVLSANNFGAEAFGKSGQAWRRSLPYAVFLGLIGLFATQFGEPVLGALGQSDDLAYHGAEVMRIAGLSLPALFLFMTTQFFLEGIRRPAPVMIAMISANILNAILNAVLIFGYLGAPEMGAAGAAWATTIARTAAAAGVLIYVWKMADYGKFAIRRAVDRDQATSRLQRRIGYGASLSIGGESVAFAALHIFAGWMGATALASFSLTFNILTMVFMLALGLGAGTSVRVGISVGRGHAAGVESAGWTGLLTNSAVMLLIGVLFIAADRQVVGLFTDEAALLAMAASLVSFAAYLLLVDGGQAVMANALRGRRDVWVPCIVQLFAFLGLMVPTAYACAIVWGMGPIGLMIGMLTGCGFSFLALTWRFRQLARRDRLQGAVITAA